MGWGGDGTALNWTCPIEGKNKTKQTSASNTKNRALLVVAEINVISKVYPNIFYFLPTKCYMELSDAVF